MRHRLAFLRLLSLLLPLTLCNIGAANAAGPLFYSIDVYPHADGIGGSKLVSIDGSGHVTVLAQLPDSTFTWDLATLRGALYGIQQRTSSAWIYRIDPRSGALARVSESQLPAGSSALGSTDDALILADQPFAGVSDRLYRFDPATAGLTALPHIRPLESFVLGTARNPGDIVRADPDAFIHRVFELSTGRAGERLSGLPFLAINDAVFAEDRYWGIGADLAQIERRPTLFWTDPVARANGIIHLDRPGNYTGLAVAPPVPEPHAWLLVGAGLPLLAGIGRRIAHRRD